MTVNRAHLPDNERLAIVEAETGEIRLAVNEIKDAMIGIRAAVEVIARVEERQIALREQHNTLAARVGRNEDRIKNTEDRITENSASRRWIERLAVPVAAALLSGLMVFWRMGVTA